MQDLNERYALLCQNLGDLEARKRKIEAAIDAVHREIYSLDVTAGIIRSRQKPAPTPVPESQSKNE